MYKSIIGTQPVLNPILDYKFNRKTANIKVNQAAYQLVYNVLEPHFRYSREVVKGCGLYFYILWFNQNKWPKLYIGRETLMEQFRFNRETVVKVLDILRFNFLLDINQDSYYESMTKILSGKNSMFIPFTYSTRDISERNLLMTSDLYSDYLKQFSRGKSVILSYDFSFDFIKKFSSVYNYNLSTSGAPGHLYSYCRASNSKNDSSLDSNIREFSIPYDELVLSLPNDYVFNSLNERNYYQYWQDASCNSSRIDSGNRLYQPFHSSPKTLRHYFQYKGENLGELFDIPNSVFLLMSVLMKDEETISKEEKMKYYELVKSGRFYDDVMMYASEQMTELFYSIHRDNIKEELQAYRNSKSPSRHKVIDGYFQTNFPGIREWLKDYPVDQEKKSKLLQKDYDQVETELMVAVHDELKNHGVESFPLYDAVYVQQKDMTVENLSMVRDFVFGWIEERVKAGNPDLTPKGDFSSSEVHHIQN